MTGLCLPCLLLAPLGLLALAGAALAWRPLMDPLPIEGYWLLLLVPMAVAVAVVYKTLKLHDLRRLPRQAAILSAQVIVFMVIVALAIWLVVEVV